MKRNSPYKNEIAGVLYLHSFKKGASAMSIQVTDNALQSTEQYVIRAKRQEQTRQIQEQQEQSQQVQQLKEVDTYDKENPVGEEVEGIYSVSHDESGNLKVDYVQPASKSNESEKINSSDTKSSGAGAVSSASNSNDDSDDDDELKKLEQQRNALQQQINREQDEDVKAQLRNQLMAVEAEIIQLKTNS